MVKLRKNKALILMTLVCFILNIFSLAFENKARANTNDINFKLEKTVDKSEVFAGEDFTYTIKYANPNTTTDAHNVVITDELPGNIKYVSYTPSEDIAVTTTGSINGHDLITFTFKEPLKAGKTGFVKITARFPAGTTQEGTTSSAINVAKIKGDNGNEVTSNPVTVTPKVNAPDWSITKAKTIPTGTPAVGGNVTYQITLKGNSTIGGLNLHDVKLVDTIPAGGEYISSSNGGVYDSGTGKVTWDIGNVNVGTSVSRTVTVKYPSVKVEDSVTNVADGYVQLFGDTTVLTKQATFTHGFAAATPSVANFTKNGRQADDRYSVGQTAQFTLSNIQNTGNVPLDKIEIVDSIPKEITLTSISTGAYSNTANVEVQYEINSSGSWQNWQGTPVPSNTNKALGTNSITLNPGEKITGVKWILTNGAEGIAPGFRNTSAIAVNGTVSKPDTGDKITNNATLTATKDGIPPIIKNASKVISVIDPMPWLVPTKTVKNGQTKFNMNDTVEYNLRIQNHAFATGDYINPIAVDILPAEMEDVQIIGCDRSHSNISNDPVVDTTQTKIIGGVTHRILKWNFTGTLTPGQYVDVKFSAKIKDQTLSGKYTNTLYITTNDQSVFENPSSGLIDDTNGLNGGTNFPNKLAAASNDVFVNFTGTADSQKWVKGELDTDWNYYDISNRHGYTLPGGVADYQLRVKNTGANGPINNIVIIDVLPYIGDIGVIDTKARDSKWRPYLVNRITGENGGPLPTGVKIYYSTNPNPSKEELKDPKNKKGLLTDGWSETPPLDITSVRSLKFDFGNNPLNKDEERILQWPMRAPYEAPANQIAWNSFGYGATFVDIGGDQPFLPSEPKKVGFEVQPDPAAKYYIGNFVWEDMNKDGLQNDGETGINSVLVNLYQYNSVTGDFEYTGRYTRTGDSHTGKTGYYEFPNVAPGTYKVEFVLPTGYKVAPYNVGEDRELDSNINYSNRTDTIDNGTTTSAIKTEDIVITDKNDFSIDAGLYRLASLGDRVWNDKNANGIQDAGEVGIPGVKVTLLDKDGNPAKYGDGTIVPDVTTDANGNYKFENLEPGLYKVKFENPNGDYKFTINNPLDSSKDSDAIADSTGLTATTAIVSLKSGENKTDVDTGMYLAQLGDYVWEDKNANGIQDAGEPGISGVKVNLLNEDGTPAKDEYSNNVPQAVTGADGKYLFDNLKSGKYVVEFIKPTGYDKFSKSIQGSDSLKDSDADTTTGKTGVITLAAGQRDMSWDAGIYKLASLGDFAWLDKNANGIQDVGEPAMPGVTVKLLDKDGNPAKYEDGTIIPDVTTDANGKYSFTSLVPGSYTVQFVKDSYYKFTDSAKGADREKDSNIDSSGKADVILASGENNITIDAGYVVNSGIKLEKTVYVGHDGGKGTGVENVKGEKGTPITYLFKVTNTGTSYLKDITLDDTTLGIDKSKMTKLSGDDLLAPGATIVYYYETTITKDFTNTAKVEGIPSDDKGTAIPNGDKVSAQDTAIIGEVIPGIKIEKTVYAGHDNGAQSGGELVVGEKGTPITYMFKITNTGNICLKDITIDDADLKINKSKMIYKERSESGLSENAPLGLGQSITYYYETTINGDLTNTAKTEGTPSDNLGNIINTASKPSAQDTAKVDEVKPSITVEKTVYSGHDGGKGSGVEVVSGKLNSDITYLFTVKNTGETDLKDITINDADLKIDKSKMIKLSGEEPLTTGASIVYYYEGKINGDLINTVQVSGTPIDSKGNAVPNTHNPVASDTAEVKLSASLGDYVWVDANANGKQEPTEKGIPKVKLILTDSKGNTKSTVTDDNGKYLFDDLMPGDYTVSIDKTTIPTGMVPSYELDITLDYKVNVTLSSNQFKDDVDFGYYTPSSGGGGGGPIIIKLASVGDYVWYDKNGDGKQDSNEKGIPNVKLTLTDGSGRVSTTTTDANGKYLFSDLVPGKYTINLDANTLSKDLKQTYELDKTLNGEVTVSLTAGQFKDDIDFGYNKSGINVDDEKTPGGPSDNPKDKPEDKPSTNIDDDKTPGSPTDVPVGTPTKPSQNNNTPGDKNLPKTGTENFNLLLLGILSLTGSGLFILRRRDKNKAK